MEKKVYSLEQVEWNGMVFEDDYVLEAYKHFKTLTPSHQIVASIHLTFAIRPPAREGGDALTLPRTSRRPHRFQTSILFLNF